MRQVREVLRLTTAGVGLNEIARRVGVAPSTVRFAADLGDYTKLTIRYIPLGEAARALVITGGSGRVALDPAWYQAAAGF